MVELKGKTNTDYSASAVNLTNPPEVVSAMNEYISFVSYIANLKAQLEAYPEWEELKKAEQRLADHNKYIKTLIDEFGSYQNVGKGEYALKQRRVSLSYDVSLFKDAFPQFAPAVIREIVDISKLNGLIKGGLINQDDLTKPTPSGLKITTETESYAYIIR